MIATSTPSLASLLSISTPTKLVHASNPNLICKLRTTQFQGEETMDSHPGLQRPDWPRLCAAAVRYPVIESESCWSVYAAGESGDVLQWKQMEMQWWVVTHASVCWKTTTEFRVGWNELKEDFHVWETLINPWDCLDFVISFGFIFLPAALQALARFQRTVSLPTTATSADHHRPNTTRTPPDGRGPRVGGASSESA